MRFEVRHPGGTPHEVDIPATIAVLGRDPASDVVLNDPKCSRRHAVVEMTAQGLLIRDAGSSNGIYVNGKRADRSPLHTGDVVRLGDVALTLLADAGGTLVVFPDALESVDEAQPKPQASTPDPAPRAPLPPRLTPPPRAAPPREPVRAPRPAPRPGPTPNLPRTRQAEREKLGRPLFVSTLAVLWLVSILLHVGTGVALVALGIVPASGWPLVAVVTAGLLAVVVSLAMAAGLWLRSPVARWAQVVIAALGLVNCPFSLASGLVLYYALRPAAAVHFSRGRNIVDLEPHELALVGNDASETVLTVALLGLVALGILASAGILFWVNHTRP